MSRFSAPRAPWLPALLALFVGWQTSGCATTKGAEGAGAKAESNHAPLFLWEVKPTDDRPGRAYLYGSVHLLPKELPPVDRAVTRRFDEASDLVFEADPSPEATANIQQLVQELAVYPGDETLAGVLGEELFELTQLVTEQVGLPGPAIQKMRPWLVSIMIEVYVASQLGFDQESGTEQWAMRRAAGQKEIHELEGAEAQLRMFADIPIEVQIDQLRHTVENIGEAPGSLQKVVDLYHAGDADALTAHTFDKMKASPSGDALVDAFFYKRNAKMADGLDAMLAEDKTYFVVVGTGHFIGPKKIQDFLEEKGYTIERVAPEGPPSAEELAAKAEAEAAARAVRFSPERAAEIRAEIQALLDAGDYKAAAIKAQSEAIQIRNGEVVVDGFPDVEYASIREMGCEPLEWYFRWNEALGCWTDVLTARSRTPAPTGEPQARAAWGGALAAQKLGLSEQAEQLASLAGTFYTAKAELAPRAQARFLSVKAELIESGFVPNAFEASRMAAGLMADLYPPEHPAWRPVLMTLSKTAWWLGRDEMMRKATEKLVTNLESGTPELPAVLHMFKLQRAGLRARAGEKEAARKDLDAALAGLRGIFDPTSATLIQYLEGAGKVYIALGDMTAAKKIFDETEQNIAKAGDSLGAMGPVLSGDLADLRATMLLAQKKRKQGLAARRAVLAEAQKHLADRPHLIGIYQCRLAQSLEEFKTRKKEVKTLREAAAKALATHFQPDHPIFVHCAKGTWPW